MVRTGFRTILQQQYPDEIEFIGEAPNGKILVETVARCRPDVVITDIQMPLMNGIEACRIIKQQHPETPIIAFSGFSNTDYIIKMLQAGASGYVVKTCEKEELVEAIQTVSRHSTYYCSSISEKMYGQLVNSNHKKRLRHTVGFGAQENRVMQLICQQHSTKEIAAQMSLAVKTVEHYRQNIQEKIGARNVVGIALYAVVHDIVNMNELLSEPVT